MAPRGQMGGVGEQVNNANSLMPLLKALITFLIGSVGLTLGGMMGSLVVPVPAGIGAIGGAFVGVLLFSTVGLFATGLFWEIVPSSDSIDAGKFMPNVLTPLVADHAAFTLILTLQSVQNIQVNNRLPWAKPNYFCLIQCGDNPIKSTCVKDDGIFNEQFRIDVTAADSVVNIYIKDQAWFSSKVIGQAIIDIRDDILNPQFPRGRQILIEGGEGCTLAFLGGFEEEPTVTCSFGHAGDVQDPFALGTKNQENVWPSDYGSVSYLSSLQFNQTQKVDFDAIAGTKPALKGKH